MICSRLQLSPNVQPRQCAPRKPSRQAKGLLSANAHREGNFLLCMHTCLNSRGCTPIHTHTHTHTHTQIHTRAFTHTCTHAHKYENDDVCRTPACVCKAHLEGFRAAAATSLVTASLLLSPGAGSKRRASLLALSTLFSEPSA